MDVIIFPNDNGWISIITPANCGLTIDEIAQKDVPGDIYEIVDDSTLPWDVPRELWTWV